jgi:hypothetical protein
MMTPSRLERGSTANPIANFRRRRRQYGEPQTALVVERTERLWKNEGATGRKQFERFKPRNRLNKPNLLPPAATGCPQSRMVRRGRRFASVRGLCKSAARRRFLVQIDLLNVDRAVGMEPFMELSRPRGRTVEPNFQPWPAALVPYDLIVTAMPSEIRWQKSYY